MLDDLYEGLGFSAAFLALRIENKLDDIPIFLVALGAAFVMCLALPRPH